MADQGYDALTRDLVALGRDVHAPTATAELTAAVLDRVATQPEPRGATGWAARWRSLVGGGPRGPRRRIALVVGLACVVLLATPPVRAAVADWFGFGAVRVERGTPDPGPVAPPPDVARSGSPAEAAATVDFPVSVPALLGDPDGVEVAADRRSVSMAWTTDDAGPLRLDQYHAQLDYSVVKTATEVSFVSVDGRDAVWFDGPHEVALIGPGGERVTDSARLAGTTLIWQVGEVTLRLEGELTLDRAVAIAESTAPVD